MKLQILITPLPIPGVNVETAWAMQQIQAGHAIEEISQNNTQQIKQSSILVKLIQQLQPDIKNHDVFLLDPTQRYCDTDYCYLVRDGIANFRDTSHLTEAAAQKLEPEFREALLWSQKNIRKTLVNSPSQ